ncbi:MAG: murein biosynthesis integral membrane protein MurJ, partial [Synergistaceae bacterium]|nr:murein biosynthesis integral membrane protein MurJ [Synergistaceae bacterium]
MALRSGDEVGDVREERRGDAPLVRHAMMMMAGTLLSRVLGLVREVVVASCFGATRGMDAFNVANTLANLARQLVAVGALSAAFVPVFSQALQRDR